MGLAAVRSLCTALGDHAGLTRESAGHNGLQAALATNPTGTDPEHASALHILGQRLSAACTWINGGRNKQPEALRPRARS